jgi:type VI protein secretion system component Hcp
MAIDSYMYFQDYSGNYLKSESQVDLKKNGDQDDLYNPFKAAFDSQGLFEVEDYSFDVEQTLSIGSQSSGAGAGKITFNPFSITRKIDVSSNVFFANAASGKSFKQVGLGMRKSSGGDTSGTFFLAFTFKLVAVKTLSWAHDDEAPKETVTFEYGGLMITYARQKPDGSFMSALTKGWNKVKNISDDSFSNHIT